MMVLSSFRLADNRAVAYLWFLPIETLEKLFQKTFVNYLQELSEDLR